MYLLFTPSNSEIFLLIADYYHNSLFAGMDIVEKKKRQCNPPNQSPSVHNIAKCKIQLSDRQIGGVRRAAYTICVHFPMNIRRNPRVQQQQVLFMPPTIRFYRVEHDSKTITKRTHSHTPYFLTI